MRLVFLVLFVFLLSACEFSTADDTYDNLGEPSERKPSSVSGDLPAINIGKSWTVVKQEPLRAHEGCRRLCSIYRA